MGSGAGKSLMIPLVYADRNPNVSSFKFSQKQRFAITEPFHKLKSNYQTIPTHKLNLTQPIKVVHGIVGLRNLGNTCYFNTAIHCLSHTPPLLDYFLSKLYEKEINKNSKYGSKGQVTISLAQLFLDIWKDERCIVMAESTQAVDNKQKFEALKNWADPLKLQLLIQRLSKRFEIGYQEDCQELLSYLLDMIHEDLNRCPKKIDLQCKDYSGPIAKEEWAAESWGEHLKANKSIIVDLFQGQLKSTIQCLSCNYQSHKWEPFLFLNLPINQQSNCTLTECLDLFQKEELLDGNSQWHCPLCRQNRDCKKSMRIWKLPNILVIHLKRFAYGHNSQGKITTKVDFPVNSLDMNNYSVEQNHSDYSLYAVAQHHGSLQFGHYVAACKHRINGQWYMYNDDEVFMIQDINKMIVNEYAYVLFYQRESDEIFRQTVTDPKSWPHFQLKQQTLTLMDYNQEDQQGQLDISPKQNNSSLMQRIDSTEQTVKSPNTLKETSSVITKLEKEWGIEKKIEQNTQKKFVELRNKKYGKN